MHDIDLMLKLQLEGKHKEAKAISDKIEINGPENLKDSRENVTKDIWFRHCFNRGWFIINEGDYQAGCQLLEYGRYLNVYGSPPLYTQAPIFNPEEHDIRGKSIIISLEGGYGDEIIHSRFATSFKKMGAKSVYIASSPELVSVFERISGVDGVILRNQANTVPHDFWVPGFSAGWITGHTFENFSSDPYLLPKHESVEIWKSMFNSDKIKVGIRWAGNPKFEHQQFRKFPENFITNLNKYDELQLYSLQRDHNILSLPEGVIDLQHFLLSWEDTMAAIYNLDIVISSCTSIAHMAAAMGKETWVITPILPYHTWTPGAPNSDTSPYYKCVRLFRQDNSTKWNGCFQKLYSALEERFNLKHIDMPDEDRVYKKLNLGCGLQKLSGFVNVDKSNLMSPDEKVNLDITPWPWNDSEFNHIVAKDILEHLGNTNEDFIDIIKEMYRVSENGAIWEVQVPHWRCDTAIDDLSHKRQITLGMFNLFNKKKLIERAKAGQSDSLLAFEHDIDIEVCDVQFEYTQPWQDQLKQGKLSEEELNYALNHFNNVALSTRMLIQVHKPGRIDDEELKRVINDWTVL